MGGGRIGGTVMDILKIMEERHSVRQYKDAVIEEEKRKILNSLANVCSAKSGLTVKIVYDEPEGFDSKLAHYGKLKNVKNYIALFGVKGMDEAAGYYGEELVLKAQEIGLNTCWVYLTFNRKAVKRLAREGEMLYCVIAIGYGETQGIPHKNKPIEKLTEIKGEVPDGFYDGVKAALLAPTATNQQKFKIKCINGDVSVIKRGIGFCIDIDLGIVKYHFEQTSGIKVFKK